MSKKITVSLDGKELTLNVGIDGFYQVYKEATGKDLLLSMGNIDSASLTEFGQGATYAGYVCDCVMNDLKPTFTKEQIFKWVFCAEGYSAKLLNQFSELNKTEEVPGEMNGQPKELALMS